MMPSSSYLHHHLAGTYMLGCSTELAGEKPDTKVSSNVSARPAASDCKLALSMAPDVVGECVVNVIYRALIHLLKVPHRHLRAGWVCGRQRLVSQQALCVSVTVQSQVSELSMCRHHIQLLRTCPFLSPLSTMLSCSHLDISSGQTTLQLAQPQRDI